MPSTAERLWETASTLPADLLLEVLDFAEFLRARQLRQQSDATGAADVPLSSLCGGLTDSATFAGSPVSIQEQLRNEWR